MVKKKIKVVVEPFDDIKIIGITTRLEDFQLAWHLNNTLDINLIRYPDICNEDGELFSFFYYNGGENSNAFNLVALSNDEVKWVKFSPSTDFLFIIRNFITDEKLQKLLSQIKQIPDIAYSYLIDLDQNKKIDTLLEDIEMHESDLDMQRKEEERQKETGEYWFDQKSDASPFKLF